MLATPSKVVLLLAALNIPPLLDPNEPVEEAKLTVWPDPSRLPLLSVTVAVKATVPFGMVVAGSKLNVRLAAAPGTKVMLTEPVDPPELAVILALPLTIGAVSVTVATPLEFVVAVVVDSVPALLAKVTVAPEITTPDVFLTVALMLAELKPSAVRLAALEVTTTLPTTGGVAPPTP